MPEIPSSKKVFPSVAVSAVSLAAFFLLYLFRHLDDNRLTSWKWSFAHAEPALFFALLAAGLVAAYVLSMLPRTSERPVLLLLVVSYAVSVFFWQIPEVIVDTSRYFTQAKHLELYGFTYFVREWGHGIHAWTDLPLVPALYGTIFKFFGESRTYIQLFTSLLFSLTVVLTFLTGKILWNRETGTAGAALLMGIPYLYSQVPLMLVDTATMCFLMLSVFTCIKALERGGIWIAIASAAVFCTVFAKYSTWMMLSVLIVIWSVYMISAAAGGGDVPVSRKDAMRRGALVLLCAGIMGGAVVAYKYAVISEQIRFLREYQAPGLRRWGESFASTFLYQVHPFITLAALYSVYKAFRKKDVKFVIIFWLVLLVVLFQVRRARYAMVIFPMFTLMAAYALQEIRSKETRRFIVLGIVVSSVIVAAFVYLPFLKSMSPVNLMDAGRYLNSLNTAKVEVLTVPSTRTVVNPAVGVPIFDLYTRAGIVYHEDNETPPPAEIISTSPLRFTWEYENPDYYMEEKEYLSGSPAVAIIVNKNSGPLPERILEKVKGCDMVREFNSATGIFRYRPAVKIYFPCG